MSWLHFFLTGDGFMPHGCRYLWNPGLIWLHVLSDGLIALSYYSIPLTLIYFVRRRRNLAFSWIYLCFALFIVACGTTHVMAESSRLYLSRIIASSQKMSVLIDDLLAFSRMGAAEMHRTPVDCDALAREVAAEVAEREPGRNIEWRIAPLPRVGGDPALLRQVWVNLLGNAVKYTRDRNPAVIEVGCREQEGFFEFHVRDNGIGFDMEHAHRLFQIFERLPEGLRFEGTGVGLANVRRIVERHGGQTRAEGKPGAGAVFFFTLAKVEPTF